jgi:hypothetical protein
VGGGGGAGERTRQRKEKVGFAARFHPLQKAHLAFFFISWDFIFPGEKFPSLCVSFRGIPQTGKKSQNMISLLKK